MEPRTRNILRHQAEIAYARKRLKQTEAAIRAHMEGRSGAYSSAYMRALYAQLETHQEWLMDLGCNA